MKFAKYLILLGISLFSSVFGDFEENEQLVETLRENNVRLVVLCNFQGTNNVLDIVTSSRSPGYELTENGLDSLNKAITRLAKLNISHIYTAPVFRAQQTTNLLGKALGLAPENLSLDSRLSMQNFGVAEGEDYDLYKQRFTSDIDMLTKGAPKGEPGISVFNRLQDFLLSLTSLHNKTVLVITHGFNYCYISKCLTGKYGTIPPTLGKFVVYDFKSASK